MKKTYIIPETQVIELDMQQPMLAGSISLYGESTTTQFAPDMDEFDNLDSFFE